MSSPRPGSVTAAAVLSIIYGSLLTLCGLCSLVMLVAQGAIGENLLGGGNPVQKKLKKEIEDVMRRDVPGYQVVGPVNNILSLGEAIALLCAGIGLLNMRSWARSLALWICLVIIAHTIFHGVYQSVFVIPALNRLFQEVLPPFLVAQNADPKDFQVLESLRMVTTLAAIMTVIIYVLLVVYLVIIVVLLCRQHVRSAFVAAAAGQPLDSQSRPGVYEDEPYWGTDQKDEGNYR